MRRRRVRYSSIRESNQRNTSRLVESYSSRLRPMSQSDRRTYSGALDFPDGTPPLIDDGEYASIIVSGIEGSNLVLLTLSELSTDQEWSTEVTSEEINSLVSDISEYLSIKYIDYSKLARDYHLIEV